jgi:ABC-2 type transport system permease protein
MKVLRDTWLIFSRSLWLTLRQPVWVFFGLMVPVLYLTLFGPVLDGAMRNAATGTSSFNWFVPGLLIQIAMFGSAFAGFSLVAELRYGVVERMRVTPISRIAMLLGRSLRDGVILVAQSLLLILLAIPFGLSIDPAGVAIVLALVLLIGLVMAPLSYTAGLILRSEDALAPVVNGISLPLLLLSGILLPMQLAPGWLQTISQLNPLTHGVNAARAVFNSDWANPEIVLGVVIMAILAAIAIWIASKAFNRAVA